MFFIVQISDNALLYWPDVRKYFYIDHTSEIIFILTETSENALLYYIDQLSEIIFILTRRSYRTCLHSKRFIYLSFFNSEMRRHGGSRPKKGFVIPWEQNDFGIPMENRVVVKIVLGWPSNPSEFFGGAHDFRDVIIAKHWLKITSNNWKSLKIAENCRKFRYRFRLILWC